MDISETILLLLSPFRAKIANQFDVRDDSRSKEPGCHLEVS